MISNTEIRRAAVAAAKVARTGDCLAGFKLEVAHHLPGRLRLRSAVIKQNAAAAENLRATLAEIAGVRSVTVNPDTGSVLLTYDPAVLTPDRLLELLLSTRDVADASEKSSAAPGWADSLAGAVRDWAIHALAQHLALAVISVLV